MIPIKDTIPSRKPPIGTICILLVNGLVFLLELALAPSTLEQFVYLFGAVPRRVLDPEWAAAVGYPSGSLVPFFSSMFIHGSLLHVALNMWMLWIFGDNVEERMGTVLFLVFYLVGGVLSGVAHVVLNASSTVPAVGASGAVAAVMGAYFIMFPQSRVIVIVPLFFWPLFFEVYAFLFMLIWFYIQFMSGVSALLQTQAAGIAWWAHVGGFVAGAVLWPVFAQRRRRPRAYEPDEYGVEDAWR